MANRPHFLIVEAYPAAARDELRREGAAIASELYSKVLQQCAPGSTADICYGPDLDQPLPDADALKAYDGVVWTGSNLTIYDDVPEVTLQLELARTVFSLGIPQFGSCWAAQIAVTAAGGKCAAHPDGIEFGIARGIQLSEAGKGHPMYQGKKAVFDAFISHYDEITHLPAGTLILSGNDYTRVQGVAVTHLQGEFWAPQYHPEYDLNELAALCYARRQRLTDLGFFASVSEAEQFVEDLRTLHHNPQRKDIAWRLGISADLTRAEVRQAELRNWINLLVMPRISAAG